MKLIKSFRRFFHQFILKLTPSGRKELIYEKALSNMKEASTITQLEKRMLKSQVNFYVNRVLKKKNLSAFHLATIINAKYGKELAAGGMKWHMGLYKVVDA